MRRLYRDHRRRGGALLVMPISGCVQRDILTLEGLGSRHHPDPVQAYFIQEQAARGLLPQRHDHDRESTADAKASSYGNGGTAGSAV